MPDEPTPTPTPEPTPSPTPEPAPAPPSPEPATPSVTAEAPPPDYSGLQAPGILNFAPTDLDAITAMAAQHKMAPQGLSELLDKIGEQQVQVWEGYLKEIEATRDRQAVDWIEQAKAEDGQKFEENFALANKVLNEFADEDFRKWLDDSRLRAQPGLRKMLVKIAKATGEAPLLAGVPVAGAAVDPMKVMYPNSPALWAENQVARN